MEIGNKAEILEAKHGKHSVHNNLLNKSGLNIYESSSNQRIELSLTVTASEEYPGVEGLYQKPRFHKNHYLPGCVLRA